MASWAEFAAREPALAGVVRRAFAVRKHATMATVRASGAPRISGTEVEFADDGEIYLGMMKGARRVQDLRRDPRMALHSPTNDAPDGDPAGWLGEAKINARAVEVASADSHCFRLDIEDVVHTKVAADAQALEITTWRPGSGATVVRRAD
ncbi:MAG TPA: pyridoxamine 5'-phosphate oxidase family protein [Actinomycetota bacterium]|nr:pyridoxamine 5'-phosphate oxidase family protein [Actinomycetota bacterium]